MREETAWVSKAIQKKQQQSGRKWWSIKDAQEIFAWNRNKEKTGIGLSMCTQHQYVWKVQKGEENIIILLVNLI